MNICPPEIVSQIIQHLKIETPSGFNVSYGPPPRPVIADLAACSATSRMLSIAARPLVFENVIITSKESLERLIALSGNNVNIPRWIKGLGIDALPVGGQLRIAPDKRAVELLKYLGSSSCLDLMTRLDGVISLEICALANFRVLRPWIKDMERVWTVLARMRSITTLIIKHAPYPSWIGTFEHLYMIYPQLVKLYVDSRQFTSPTNLCDIPSPGPQTAFSKSRLGSVHFLRNPRDWVLFPRIRYEMLAEVNLQSGYHDDLDCWSFNCYQTLFNSAPNLRIVHVRSGHENITGSLDLQLNLFIDEISFGELIGDIDWVSTTLLSIPTSAPLKRIKLSSLDWEAVEGMDESIDTALSHSRFACNDNLRTLILEEEGTEHDGRDTGEDSEELYSPQYKLTLQNCLHQTQRLQWFNIKWPT